MIGPAFSCQTHLLSSPLLPSLPPSLPPSFSRCVDPAARLTPAQALAHPWVLVDDELLRGKNLEGAQAALKRFNARRKFRASVQTVRGSCGLPFFFFFGGGRSLWHGLHP